MNAIGQTARFVRESRGLTQRAAAEALGVSAVHLSNLERGRTQPSAALIVRLKEVFGLDVYTGAVGLPPLGGWILLLSQSFPQSA
jgi:transcriptional regulator with XRE-family HTH domain